jgi:hypothetical protein
VLLCCHRRCHLRAFATSGKSPTELRFSERAREDSNL